MRPARSRRAYALALVLVIAAGLGSRVFGRALPAVVAAFAGDTLYATMVFVVLGILAPRWSTPRLAAAALACACAIEISQLYHAPWIDHFREYPLGALILGNTFAWPDLLAYTIGVLMGASLEKALRKRETETWL